MRDESAERTKSSWVGASEGRLRDAHAENGTAVETAKFDLGAPPPAFDAGELPWSYGEDRITALVRSPDSMYLYWEITDDAIAAARRRLGRGGDHAWCNLRVYDTTGRAFDGTNANDYFDIRVDRTDREWFLQLHRPTATFHVEIGMKSHEGFFQAIARSGRADFPRKSPSPNHALEWMTVTSDPMPPAARPYESRYKGPPPGSYVPPPAAPQAHAPEPRGSSQQGPRQESRTWTWAHPAHVEVRWEGPWVFDEWRAEWRMRWIESRGGRPIGGLDFAQWRVGPFPIHLVDPDRLEFRLLGEGPFVLEEHMSGLEVFGPWELTIKGAPTEPQRRVLSQWRIHWARVEPAKVERWITALEHRRTGAWERREMVGGGSQAHMLLEGGASEAWRMGGSERWAIGASQWAAMGGSETLWLGASQLQFAGASALLFGGASAFLYGGASGMAWGGASEWALGGASGMTWGGASEWALGGASESLGGSELMMGSSTRWSDSPFGMGQGHGEGE